MIDCTFHGDDEAHIGSILALAVMLRVFDDIQVLGLRCIY